MNDNRIYLIVLSLINKASSEMSRRTLKLLKIFDLQWCNFLQPGVTEILQENMLKCENFAK